MHILSEHRKRVFGVAVSLAILLVFIGASSTFAETDKDVILSLPDEQVILSISATEQREVQEDLLVATLGISAENADARVVQNEINSAMQKALTVVSGASLIDVNTGNYQVYETRDPRTKEKKWQGRQTLVLKSREAQALLELVSKIQGEGFTVSSLNYTLDPQTARSLQDDMLEAALLRLQKRAARAAKALGKSHAELKDVTVQDEQNPYPENGPSVYRMQASSFAGEVAPPVAQAGKTTVSLTVAARALLKP